MMDAAYFVGRKELLEFFNDLLDLNLQKIEQTAPGHIACQLTNLIFPGSIPMSRVNWGARSDYEFIQNYKLLQVAFTKHSVQRHIDVDKLIRAKYQDNLEWCQWLKAFYEHSGSVPDDEYDPRAIREKGKGGKVYNAQMGGGGARKPTTTATARPAATRPKAPAAARPKPASKAAAEGTGRPSRPLRERSNPVVPKATESDNKQQQGGAAVAPADATLVIQNEALTAQVKELTEEVEELDSKNSELTAQVEELEVAVLETESERDYYFDKLRNIEVMLQVFQERGEENDEGTTKLVDDVFKILYATKEENLVVNEEGDVVVQEDEDVENLLADSV